MTGILVAGLLAGGAGPAGAASSTERVSVASDGTEGNFPSEAPAISDGGVVVAFASDATDLVAGDTNGDVDIFVRDREAGATERVSVASDGSEGCCNDGHPSISGTGRFVAFHSNSTLVGDDVNGESDVYRRDLDTGTTERVSLRADGSESAKGAFAPSISDDGDRVAFEGWDHAAPTLNDDETIRDVYVRDRSAGTTMRVSVSSSGAPGDSHSSAPAISGDGRYVSFVSDATNLVGSDTNGDTDVFVHDLDTRTTERVSVASDGSEGCCNDGHPSISDDGRFVAFHTNSTLVADDTNVESDVYVHDRDTGTTALASRALDDSGANGGSFEPAISGDGGFVAYTSRASDLVSGDTSHARDVFRTQRASGDTVRVSVGSQPDGPSDDAAITDAGGEVVFDSSATNLVAGDTNAARDVFVRTVDPEAGYLLLDAEGGIHTFGAAEFFGSLPELREAGAVGPAEAVDFSVGPFGDGYVVLDDVGGIHTFGSQEFFGSLPTGPIPIGGTLGDAAAVDVETTPSGEGYVIFDGAGGVHTFGDASFHGSLPGLRAGGAEIPAAGVDLALTPSGDGYLVLDGAGGVHTFGDAAFHGSLPALRSSGTAVGSAPALRLMTTPTGGGYVLLDDVGGIHTFGDAEFHGSLPSLRAGGAEIPAAGVDLALTPSGDGYVVLDGAGGVHTFGDAEFLGSLPSLRAEGVPVGDAPALRIAVS